MNFYLPLLSVVLIAAQAAAEVGVTEKNILLGTSNPTSGAMKSYGEEMHAGSLALFENINKNGGIHGRKIEVISLDDAYTPETMFKNTRKLVEEKKVFALFEFFGTPTVASVVPYLKQEKVPLIFPYTGGEFIRQPTIPTVFALRASYNEETYELTRYAVNELKIKDFGIFYQDDAFGTAGRTGIERGLAESKSRAVVTAAYIRTSGTVDSGLKEILAERPKAVFLVSTKKPAVEFIRKAAAAGYRPIYLAPSPLGTLDLIEALGSDADNIFISQVVPFPDDTSFAVVRNYQRDMKAAGQAKFGHISLETYINAAVFVESLRRAGPQLTRDKLISALEDLHEFDLGGIKVNFSKTSHQGLHEVFLMQIKAGQAKAVKQLR